MSGTRPRPRPYLPSDAELRGPWFYAPARSWYGDRVVLPPEESRHASRVMRLGSGGPLTVIDGRGGVAACRAGPLVDGHLTARIETLRRVGRPVPEIAVFQAAAKGDKLATAVERLAELGVCEIHVFTSSRTVVRWDPAKQGRRLERWRAHARAAAKQSRNPWVTVVAGLWSWAQVVDEVAARDHALVLWESGSEPLGAGLRGFGADPTTVALVAGPEGGLSEEEVGELRATGARVVTLGPRILRTENAAVAATAATAYHFGLIG